MVDVALLLNQSAFELRAVHLSRPEAEIRWVATSELEDPTTFLEGGELLLTTGLATLAWRSQWDQYVARLVRAGVSALALGVGLTHATVPAALVAACERHGLNLLEVPRETAFVTVSRAAARLIDKRDEGEARLALQTQRQLTSAAVSDDARRAVVDRLAQLLDGCAFLLAADGRVAVAPAGPRPELAAVDSALAELTRMRADGLRAASSASDERGTSLLLPVGLRGRPAYYLAVAVSGRVTNVRRNAVTTAVALLGLAVEQERGRLETRRRLWQKMSELLVRGEVEAAQVVGEAADLPALPAQVQVVRAAGAADVLDDALSELERERALATVDDDVLRLVAAPARAARAAERLSARGLAVGLGESAELSAAARADTTARLALERATGTSGVVRWEKVVREGAVGLLAADVAASFSVSFLGGLDDDQAATLGSFLKHHGSRLKVAEELGLHRNTVRNRVAQIELVIGRSLDDPDTRAAAWLAWQARALPE